MIFNSLAQANLDWTAISASDTEHFGHNFISTPVTNTTIVTFQNIGQQPNEATKSKSTHNALAFRSSNAGVAMFAEHGLNEAKLQLPHLFNTRMKSVEPRSFSYITNNINKRPLPLGFRQEALASHLACCFAPKRMITAAISQVSEGGCACDLGAKVTQQSV